MFGSIQIIADPMNTDSVDMFNIGPIISLLSSGVDIGLWSRGPQIVIIDNRIE